MEMSSPFPNRDAARAYFAERGLTYASVTSVTAIRLRDLIDQRMRASGTMRGTFRMRKGLNVGRYADCPAALRCRSHYFTDRQAITFEPTGFIGIAGWADDSNVRPILDGFKAWVDEIAGDSDAITELPGDAMEASNG